MTTRTGSSDKDCSYAEHFRVRLRAIAPSKAVDAFRTPFPIDVPFITRGGTVVKHVIGFEPRRISGALRAFAAELAAESSAGRCDVDQKPAAAAGAPL